MALERAPLLADETLRGQEWCAAHSRLVDEWLASLLAAATGGGATDVALVAVGGYGRSELCPNSDIDVMLVHDRRGDIAAVADRVWYPIWDEALHLGHSVCTVREALSLAADDLDTATALLSVRHVAGNPALADELAVRAREQWKRSSRKWLAVLRDRVAQRHEVAGEVAFHLEPDLKDGRGGLRDVHSMLWAEAAERVLLEHDSRQLHTAYGALLDARVELHRATGRPSNLLTLQEQPTVAKSLGDDDTDQLMTRLASAARSIAWTSDDTWRRVDKALQRSFGRRRPHRLDTGISLSGNEVVIDETLPLTEDPVTALRVAVHAAEWGASIDRESLEALARSAPALPDPWPDEARRLLVRLLATGPPAVPLIEALDQRDVWTRILPEWAPVRSRPQHNAYHRYTVDRHLLEAAANAAVLADRVSRPDLLLVGALLHDLGKGYPGDHTAVGTELATRLATRMGFPPADAATVAALVEHHLLLADIATRRDLDDPATIDRVAATVLTVERLQLLAALTEADSVATGPSAWGSWKAGLVAQLVDRVAQALGGDGGPTTAVVTFPSGDQLARLASGEDTIDAGNGTLTVLTTDRPGVFSRVAGVLALHGLDVLAAAAYSSDEGRALAEFHVVDPYRTETPWPKVTADIRLALDGRLAVHARVAERARTYLRGQPRTAPAGATVKFDTDASADAVVIDVHTSDGVGVLYRITSALAELDLDIRSAKVQTLGHQVVDAFYVTDRTGGKITDGGYLAEIERAILHALRDQPG